MILVLLRLIAELSPHTSATDAKGVLPPFYSLLQHFLPLKPQTATEQPKIYFSEVECLLYIFHNLASKAPASLHPVCGVVMHTGQPSELIGEDFSEKLNDFTARLKYCEEYTVNYIRSLNQVSEKLKGSLTEGDEEAMKTTQAKLDTVLTALKTNKNIKELVQALNKKQPTFLSKGSSFVLSWRQPKNVVLPNSGSQKRGLDPNSASSSGSQAKRTKGVTQQLYVPPNRASSHTTVGVRGRTRGRVRGANKSWRGA